MRVLLQPPSAPQTYVIALYDENAPQSFTTHPTRVICCSVSNWNAYTITIYTNFLIAGGSGRLWARRPRRSVLLVIK